MVGIWIPPSGIRRVPLALLYTRNAVHAAMAGKTRLVIGFLHDSFVHIPIEMLVLDKTHIDTDGVRWKAVPAATGQPARLE
jgi:6-phosphofructokinase 1